MKILTLLKIKLIRIMLYTYAVKCLKDNKIYRLAKIGLIDKIGNNIIRRFVFRYQRGFALSSYQTYMFKHDPLELYNIRMTNKRMSTYRLNLWRSFLRGRLKFRNDFIMLLWQWFMMFYGILSGVLSYITLFIF